VDEVFGGGEGEDDALVSTERRRLRGFKGGVGMYSSSVASPPLLSKSASSSEL